MKQYRKKPVVIEAMVFDDSVECLEALSAAGLDPVRVSYSTGEPKLIVSTLEGDLAANVGDYIIKGVKGEFYPCKPDVFAMTYEQP
ncbi:hypothetical protein [Anaeromusa sp.]|uniref:hypothetical protein n=1 Tax=Anaeromusa sp. TaxID=1872520 RepID=UPI00262FBD90|nr:hypothetical protein [Anaeromusa sp.]MDD3157018.1 hypothetical protein [Anaeromusa sp.]